MNFKKIVIPGLLVLILFGLGYGFKANAEKALAVLFSECATLKVAEVKAERQETIRIIATGDLMLAHRAVPYIQNYGIDYPFSATRKFLSRADIAISNLEAPFATKGTSFEKKYTFKSPPEFAKGIKNAGIDVLTLANNHIMDFGPDGLRSTLQTLDKHNLHYCGAGMNRLEAVQPAIVYRGGWKVGFLAYSLTYPEEFWATSKRPGTVYPVPEKMHGEIADLKEACDIVVVSFHWGGEMRIHPKGYQKNYAHQAIDAGADLIIGHHPHVLQGFELYKKKLIAYSLGNYAFGSLSNAVDTSVLFEVSFDNGELVYADIIPIDVNNYRVHFSPKVLSGEKRKSVIQEVNNLSSPLNKSSFSFDWKGRFLMQNIER